MSTQTKPVSIVKIHIVRVEGGTDEPWYEFNTMQEANTHLRIHEASYAKLGYDKHDFVIEWEDGSIYRGTIDCKHPQNKFHYAGCNRLDEHIRYNLSWILKNHGRGSIGGLISDDDCEYARDRLANYEI